MMKMKCLALLTAYFLICIHAEGKDNSNSTLSQKGSHYLFKLDNTGTNTKRSSRCTPCGNDPGDRREVTNHLDPEYRGNGADNLGYDWSPRAWGGPAFSNRMRNRGRPFMNDGWDRERGGRQMPGNWNAPSPNHFNCDSCRMIWERERGSRTHFGDNNFSSRTGRWQNDQNRYQGEVATVTSPPIALRPESRIAYVPSPGGEMYWDGVSGGGTRWDGFSNGISWLMGGTRPYDGPPRGDPRGYDQGPKRPDDYRDKNVGYFRPWVGEPNRGPPPRYYPSKGYGDRGPNPDQDERYNGYASKWHYGTTNQNGWNGNNMKWSYGSKNWDNRGGGSYFGGKFDEDSNPLSHGHGPSSPYGQGNGPQYGSGGFPSPYGQGGAIQYGQGGSVYYDQGKFIFHYGQGGSPQYPMFKPSNQYPQDGNPPPHPAAESDYGSRPSRPQKPWDYNANDRYDNRDPGYSNINWIRPGPTDPGYSKPPSHGKYPSGGYDDKRKPWPSRPTSGGPYGPGPGFPHGSTGYITGSVTYGGERYPGGRPNQGTNYGGNEYPGGQGGYPGSSESSSYPSSSGGSVNNRYPGSSGSSGYPGGSGGSYPGGSGGSYPGGGGGSYPAGSGGSYPGGGGGSYPGGSGGSYPAGSGGSYPGGSGGPYPGGSGGSYPGGSGGSYPAGSGGSYPGGSGGSYPGGSGGSYPGGSGGPYPAGSGGSYPGGSGGPYPGGSGGSYPGGSGGSYPAGSGGSYPGGSGGFYPGGSGGHGYPGPNYISRPGGSGGYPSTHGSSGGYNGPADSGSGYRPSSGGFGQPGNYYGPRPPPKGYYTGFITELNPNKYPNGVHIGGSYPIGDKGSYPEEGQWNGNRYPGGEKYPSEAGDGYHSGHSDRYPSHPEGDRHRPGSQDRFPSDSNAGEDGNAWNYGQEGHKDGIYRRTGGSYPPYRGGPYYTSSYLASASTPSGVSQAPSESKTQTITKADEVTKPTPETS